MIKKICKVGAVLLALTFFLVMLTGCVSTKTNTFFSSGYQLQIWGSDGKSSVDKIEARISDLEKNISAQISTSDIARINAAEANVAVSVSSDTIYLLKLSKVFYEKTHGEFNPAIYPIVKLWGFDADTFAPDGVETTHHLVPAEAEIAATLAYSDLSMFTLDEKAGTVTKSDARAMLEFGASAKGYAADEGRTIAGSGADFLFSIGNSTILIGAKEHIIGMASPFDKSKYTKLKITAGLGVGTAGVYERNFTIDNVLYHHIFDKTGHPAGLTSANPAVSVTVISASATVADILSTVGILLPAEQFEAILKEYKASATVIYQDQTSIDLNGFDSFYTE